MFKSVFTKFVFVVMLIILISFTVLSLILVSNSINTSQSMKRDSIEDAADALGVFLENAYSESSTSDFGKFVYYENVSNDVSTVLDTVSASLGEEMSVFITDENGTVLL